MLFSRFSRVCVTSLVFLVVALGAMPPRGHAAETTIAEDVANAYNGANQKFQKGDWMGAAAGMEQVITMVMALDEKAQGQLAPVFYMLGASYFNAEKYDKAIEAFKKYLDKFPAGERATEVKLSWARAAFLSHDYPTAIKIYKLFETVPQYRDFSMYAESEAWKESGKQPEEIAVLEKLISPEIRTTLEARGAIRLVTVYTDKGDSDKAVNLLSTLQKKTALIENLISLNELAIRLGDELAEKQKYAQAIQAYRAVRSREDVLKFQRERIASMEKRMEFNLKNVQGNPQAFVAATDANNQIKEVEKEAKELLTDFEKLPDFTPTLLFRVAKCWYDWDKKWEAIVVYHRLLDKYSKDPGQKEEALFAMLVTYSEVNQIKACQRLCEQYVKEFPEGPNAGTVGYIAGAVSLQAKDPKTAEYYFSTMLDKVTKSEYREKMRYLLGVSQFMQGKFPEAFKNFDQYVQEYPNGEDLEEVRYRRALSIVFQGEFDKARTALNEYLNAYSSGKFVADCKYRLMVCDYAAQNFDAVVKAAKAWRERFPKDTLTGEVCAILGDSLAAEGKDRECYPAYIDSYKAATTEEVVNYSLFEASKHMQKLALWPEVSKMFEEFVKEKPDHPAVVAAMYWIGKARAREGKTEEAKQFLVNTLKTYINDPKKEAVELLLEQLAQLCSKRPRALKPPAPAPAAPGAAAVAGSAVPAAGAAAASHAATAPPVPATPAVAPASAPAIAAADNVSTAASLATPATPAAPVIGPDGKPLPPPAPPEPPPLPPWDSVAELEKQLKPFEEDQNPTTRARLLYARSELALTRKKHDEVDDLYEKIANDFKPEDLSPVLLAKIGDFLLSRNHPDRAAVLYTRLKEEFPKADCVDYAFVGLGNIAYANKKYDEALKLFTDAIDTYAGAKIKDATIGKANTLLELKKYPEAKKLFEQVAGVREWRGESTALALFSLGEVEERQGHFAEAIAHYQRVFVAYQKFAAWAARAYIRSAESFDKMGKRKEAVNTMREMLRNDKLMSLPEGEEARKLMEKWGMA